MEVAVRRAHVLVLVWLWAVVDTSSTRADDFNSISSPLMGRDVLAAQAQQKPPTPPVTPKPAPGTPAPPARPPQVTPLPPDQTALAAPTTGRLDISQAPEVTQIVMLGDQIGIPGIAFGQRGIPGFPPFPGAIKGSVLVPSIRSF